MDAFRESFVSVAGGEGRGSRPPGPVTLAGSGRFLFRKEGEEAIDGLLGLCEGEGDADAGGVPRDGRRPDRGGVDSGVAQAGGEGEGVFGGRDDERDDGRRMRLGGLDGPARGAEGGADAPDSVREEALPLRFVAEDIEGGGDDGGLRRRGAGGVDEGAGEVIDGGDHLGGSGDETAEAAEGLADGGDDDVGEVPVRGVEPGCAGAEDTGGVGLIEDERGAGGRLCGEAIAECGEGGEIGDVAVHGVDGFGDKPDGGVFGSFEPACGDGFGPCEVGVREGPDGEGPGGAREASGVDQAGVAALVEEEEVALGGEGADGGEIGVEAGREEAGVWRALEAGEGVFDVTEEGGLAADEAGGACADAVGACGLAGRVDEARMAPESECIVGGEVVESCRDDARMSPAALFGFVTEPIAEAVEPGGGTRRGERRVSADAAH